MDTSSEDNGVSGQLPLVTPVAAPANAKALRPLLILLIEDRLNDAKLFQKVLSTASDAGRYWLIHTKRLSSALSMLQKERVDVVVLDLSLPDSEGFGSIELIKQYAPSVPIVVLTGSEDPDSSITSLQLGAQEFISKDQMNGEILSTAIRNSIERHRQRAQLEIELNRERSQLEVDPETQLSTEKIFRIRLEYALEQARRESKILGLMLIRVNGFVLDGDPITPSLKAAAWGFLANRLTHTLRKNDSVGRLNENTIGLLCYDVHDISGVHRLASKIARLLHNPFQFENGELQVSFSMGISISPFDEIISDALIASAERALEHSIQQGPDQYSFASKLLNIRATEASGQIARLKSALAEGGFNLKGTPILSFQSGDLEGLRLQLSVEDPDLATLQHHEILDICDLAGGRLEILKWISSRITSFENTLSEKGVKCPSFHLQLPANYIVNKSLVSLLLQSKHPSLSKLVIEMSENLAWTRPERSHQLLEELSAHRFQFSLDEFGLGQSSLSQIAHLKRFSLHSVGIAPALMREAARVPERKEFLLALIEAVHRLGIKVSAKGLNDEVHVKLAKSLGCDLTEGLAVGALENLENWTQQLLKGSVPATMGGLGFVMN